MIDGVIDGVRLRLRKNNSRHRLIMARSDNRTALRTNGPRRARARVRDQRYENAYGLRSAGDDENYMVGGLAAHRNPILRASKSAIYHCKLSCLVVRALC